MILGNKCDMEDKRKITKEQGEQLAKEYGTPTKNIQNNDFAGVTPVVTCFRHFSPMVTS